MDAIFRLPNDEIFLFEDFKVLLYVEELKHIDQEGKIPLTIPEPSHTIVWADVPIIDRNQYWQEWCEDILNGRFDRRDLNGYVINEVEVTQISFFNVTLSGFGYRISPGHTEFRNYGEWRSRKEIEIDALSQYDIEMASKMELIVDHIKHRYSSVEITLFIFGERQSEIYG